MSRFFLLKWLLNSLKSHFIILSNNLCISKVFYFSFKNYHTFIKIRFLNRKYPIAQKKKTWVNA